jgi:hypothetical protein
MDSANHHLEIFRFRTGDANRMIGWLTTVFQDLNVSASCSRYFTKHFLKLGSTNKPRAAAGHKNPTRLEYLNRQLIESQIPRHRAVCSTTGPSHSGRIKNHSIK